MSEDLFFYLNGYIFMGEDLFAFKRSLKKKQKERDSSEHKKYNAAGLKRAEKTLGVWIRSYFKATSPSDRAVPPLGASFSIQKKTGTPADK